MTIVTHKRSLAKCTVVGQFRDGDLRYFTLKEISSQGEYSRTFTAGENEIEFPAQAEVISFAAVQQKRKAKEQSDSVVEPVVESSEEVVVRDKTKVYINDPNLTAQDLSGSVIQGIGPITAGRILELRRNFPGGKFSSIDDLSSIKGINWDSYKDTISFD